VNWYPWIVLIHVLGAFGFVFGHGASAMVSFRLRNERTPERVATLLNVSSAGLVVTYISLLILILAGVLAGFMGDWWSSGWIWAAIGVLVLMLFGMYAMATSYYKQVRTAVGIAVPGAKGPAPEPKPPEELARLLDSSRPVVLALYGGIGLIVIIWLMVLKPF
jgi:MFS family permease